MDFMKRKTIFYILLFCLPVLLISNGLYRNAILSEYSFIAEDIKDNDSIREVKDSLRLVREKLAAIKKAEKKSAKSEKKRVRDSLSRAKKLRNDSIAWAKEQVKRSKMTPAQLEKALYNDTLRMERDSARAEEKRIKAEEKLEMKLKMQAFLSGMLNDTAFLKSDTIPRPPIKKGKKNKRLIRADGAFILNKYAVALSLYKKAAGRESSKEMRNYLAFRMADCMRKMNNMKGTETAMNQLVKKKYYEEFPIIVLYLADAQRYNGKLPKALESYELYNKLEPDDVRGVVGLESAKMINEWLERPTKHEIKNLKAINTKFDEFAPTYTNAALNELAFTTNRDGVTGKKKEVDEWTNRRFTDIYITKQDKDGKWSKAVNIDEGSGINTKGNEGAAMISPQMNSLYFTKCFVPKKESMIGNMGSKIMNSKRAGQGWGEPMEVNLGGDSTTVMGQPTFNNDETLIFFTGRLGNCIGGTDIYMAKRDDKGGDFSRPVNVGEVINTVGDECFPFLRYDTILYFASNSRVGLGGLDLYRSSLRKDAEGNIYFSEPQNLKYPMNSSSDDFGVIFAPGDVEQGYFSSNRKGGRGGDDIWSFYLEPIEMSLGGRVRDKSTLQPITGVSLVMKDLETGKTYSYTSDANGKYSFNKNQFMPNKSYEITYSKDGYFTKSVVISTGGVEMSGEMIEDVALEVVPRKPVVLPEILFELGKAELRPQFGDSLRGTIRTLELNPNIVIELGAHTDMIGSEESNDLLSQKRAEAVMAFLVQRGIDPERIVAKGYGERVPRTLFKNMKREGYMFAEGTTLTSEFISTLPNGRVKDAANALNRRIEFIILRSNFEPKQKVADSIYKAKAIAKIAIDKEDNGKRIPFTVGNKKGLYSLNAVVEGIETTVVYNPMLKASNVSSKFIEEMLRGNVIDRGDFGAELEDVVDGDGNIRKSTIVRIPSIRIGRLTLYDIELPIIMTQNDTGISLNNIMMAEFGSFTIDEENSVLIFD